VQHCSEIHIADSVTAFRIQILPDALCSGLKFKTLCSNINTASCLTWRKTTAAAANRAESADRRQILNVKLLPLRHLVEWQSLF